MKCQARSYTINHLWAGSVSSYSPPALRTPFSTWLKQENLTSSAKCFLCTWASLDPLCDLSHTTLTHGSPRSYDYPHFTDKGTKAQWGEMNSLSAQMRKGWRIDGWNKLATWSPTQGKKYFLEKSFTSPLNLILHIGHAHPSTLSQHSPYIVFTITCPYSLQSLKSPVQIPSTAKGYTHTPINSSLSPCFAFISIITLTTIANILE